MLVNLLYILAALAIMGVIVTIHEFGHYAVGRLCGIGIVEFSVGMGPRLLGFEKSGIQYSLRAIPLGGYCKFVGEDEENPDPRAMNNQPVWKRFLTVAAGPVMNFILAFVAAVILFACYSERVVPRVDVVDVDTPAAVAGMEVGDRIVAVNGHEVGFDENGVSLVQSEVAAAAGGEVEFDVERDGERLSLAITPAYVPQEDGSGRYLIGIVFGYQHMSFAEAAPTAIPLAADYMRRASTLLLDALRKLIFKGEGANEMAGTVGIISMVSQSVREGWYMVFYYLFIISLNLGIINLLPFPALDGGRLVFLIVEAIRRKPIPAEKEGLVHAIGFILFIGLFLVLTYQDIMRLIRG